MLPSSLLSRISKNLGTTVHLVRLYSKRILVPPECIQLSFVRSPGPGSTSENNLSPRRAKCEQSEYKGGGSLQYTSSNVVARVQDTSP